DINADYIDDECLDGAFDDHNDVEMSNECKFDKEVPKEDKFKVTSCVIIDYDKNPEMIEQCNQSGKNRSIYNLVGSFEVDSDVVKEVGDNVEKLGACQQHLWTVCGRNIQIPCRGLHDCPVIIPYPNLSSIPENMQHVRYICTDCLASYVDIFMPDQVLEKNPVSCVQSEKHNGDSTSSLKLIAKFINDIALSTDNNAKNNLLNHLINVIKDFNEISSGTTSSDSAVTISSDNQIIPNTFENYGKNLALSVWKSHTAVKENQQSLENPESLD
ncbi:9023_t:CDS:2, partial [Entrophospora sp. SA101]